MRRTVFYSSVALLAFGIVSLLLSSCAAAQEKPIKENTTTEKENTITEKDFKEILGKATEKLQGKIYRLTKTEENFSDRSAKPENITTKILETIPPDKKREVEELKSPTKNTRLERIWDSNNLYEKENDGAWKKYIGGGSASGDFNYTSGKTTTTYKFAGKESLNNKIADIYEVETHRIANKLTRTSQYRVEYVVKTKYWISEDGFFLKTVKESEIVDSMGFTREVEIYEYDKKMKIEAPIK